MFVFPIQQLMDEEACYEFLSYFLHPGGLSCPNQHRLPLDQAPHDRHRAPIMDYRCRTCGAVFNIFTGTLWAKTRLRCSVIVLILRGVARGISSNRLAQELDLDRSHLSCRRRAIQELLERQLPSLAGSAQDQSPE
jgi:hypothetical protein